MSLVKVSVPNVNLGVSQEALNKQAPGQAVRQENALATLSDGLIKRPPLQHIAFLPGDGETGTAKDVTLADYDGANIHYIDQGENERWVVGAFQDGSDPVLKIWTDEGVAVDVDINPAFYVYDYLDLTVAEADTDPIRFLTVGDGTIVVNPTMTPAKGSVVNGLAMDHFLIFLKVNETSGEWNISLDHDVYGTTSPANVPSSGNVNTDASDIATNINAMGGTNPYIATAVGPVVWVDYSGTLKTVEVKHKNPDSISRIIASEGVKSPEELPAYGKSYELIKVDGNPATGLDDYWVRFVPLGEFISPYYGEGYWEEYVAPVTTVDFGIQYMPHFLVNDGGAWQWQDVASGVDSFNFSLRTVGNDESNPFPKFIGKPIKDVALYRNRLVFLSEDSIDFSESGEFFNFFRLTTQNVFESDPIPLELNYSSATNLKHLLNFGQDLLVFNQINQFRITSETILANSTIEGDLVSSFPSSILGHPVQTELDVLMPYDNGDYAGMYRLEPSQETEDRFRAENITAHVPAYLKGKVKQIAVLPRENLAVVLCTGEKSSLYVYNYFVDQNQTLQSAWSKMTFADSQIEGIGFLGDELHIINKRTEGWFLEKMDFRSDARDTDQDYLTHLDRRITETECSAVVYDPVADTTEFTMPYDITSGVEMMVFTRGSGGGLAATVISAVAGGTSLVVSGDYSATEVFIGESYTMRYDFKTRPLLGERGPYLSGRYQYRTGVIDFEDTGYFKVSVSPVASDTYDYVYTGQPLGTNETILSEVSLEDGQFRFPIRSRSGDTLISITNDSAMPSKIHSMEFELEYNERGRRV